MCLQTSLNFVTLWTSLRVYGLLDNTPSLVTQQEDEDDSVVAIGRYAAGISDNRILWIYNNSNDNNSSQLYSYANKLQKDKEK